MSLRDIIIDILDFEEAEIKVLCKRFDLILNTLDRDINIEVTNISYEGIKADNIKLTIKAGPRE